ncbi:MAG: rRNA maturation RNase YbeY [Flavobacteriaceae bacterium]
MDRPQTQSGPEAGAEGSLRLNVDTEVDGWPSVIDEDFAAGVASCLAAFIDVQGEASLMLSDDDHVRALNERFRQKDRPTNVLSFPPGPGSPENYLGDVILALQTVRREADEEHKRFDHHVAHLIVHGLLHLAGYDHENDEEAEEMEALERDVLARLGIADPYAEIEVRAQ